MLNSIRPHLTRRGAAPQDAGWMTAFGTLALPLVSFCQKGEHFVRFALIENEQRISQGDVRSQSSHRAIDRLTSRQIQSPYTERARSVLTISTLQGHL